jgi:hypothetical protein
MPSQFSVPSLPPGQNEFAEQLTAEDELGSVVRAHLHIEFHVDQLLAAVAPNPKAVETLALSYVGRVRLLNVFGFGNNLTKPLIGLGQLRNKFAHRLNYKLTSQNMRALYDMLDPLGRHIVHHAYDSARAKSAGKHPKKLWSLPPKDIFSLLATTIRASLLVAYREHTGAFPEASVPIKQRGPTKDA